MLTLDSFTLKKIAWLKKEKIFDKNSKIVVPDYKNGRY